MLTFNRKVVMAVLLFLWIGFSSAVSGQEDTSAIKFSLRSIDGGNVTDADVRGKVVVFITTSHQLPVRAGHVASFRNLMHDYSPRGVDFYLVSTDSESRFCPGCRCANRSERRSCAPRPAPHLLPRRLWAASSRASVEMQNAAPSDVTRRRLRRESGA